jgi:hypothetical protein
VLLVQANQQRIEDEYEILIGQSEGWTQNGRTKRRCEDKSQMDLKGIRCESVDCIHLAYRRIYCEVEVNNFGFNKEGKFLSS